MAHRATMIGASFKIERQSPHGTRVVCLLPTRNLSPVSHVTKG
jgi:nitrate/nitrite-specific signal transduction histidine kinase